MKDFNSKIAVTTGGANGIGLAFARELAASRVAKDGTGLTNKDRLKAAAVEIQKAVAEALFIACDMSADSGEPFLGHRRVD
ncbi:hypothetical protein F5Y16DRAFT_397789 [Xylariaceae sp. FL0255]|nr:hypothetical protein F5Y16DRAFT_397789 [Xylariaceae sp. FL0255]